MSQKNNTALCRQFPCDQAAITCLTDTTWQVANALTLQCQEYVCFAHPDLSWLHVQALTTGAILKNYPLGRRGETGVALECSWPHFCGATPTFSKELQHIQFQGLF